MPTVDTTRRFWLRAKEPFNCYSHLLGVLLAIPALVALIVRSQGEPWRIIGFSIFGASLLVLYSASTLYHWLAVSEKVEDRLRRFDHVAIFFLIAGTYSPVCLVTLRGGLGWSLFGLVWVIAFAGSAAKLCLPHFPRWVTAGLYLGMGWIAVLAIGPLVQALPLPGIAWLVAGGLAYTCGAVIYGLERPDPFPRVFGFHEIFHVAVLAGSAAHFTFMIRYVAPLAAV